MRLAPEHRLQAFIIHSDRQVPEVTHLRQFANKGTNGESNRISSQGILRILIPGLSAALRMASIIRVPLSFLKHSEIAQRLGPLNELHHRLGDIRQMAHWWPMPVRPDK